MLLLSLAIMRIKHPDRPLKLACNLPWHSGSQDNCDKEIERAQLESPNPIIK